MENSIGLQHIVCETVHIDVSMSGKRKYDIAILDILLIETDTIRERRIRFVLTM